MSLKSVFECSLALAGCVTVSASAISATFSVGISPGKFELKARPGEVIRDTVLLTNPAEEAGSYLFRTTDWQLSDTGSVEYLGDEMAEGSCRPWVRLERRGVEIAAGGAKNYRFEVHVPADAPDGLCRFAIIIEPTDPYVASTAGGQVSMPILGRFAVLTYVTIGDAAPAISMLGLETTMVNGQRVPAVRLENNGTTYDRAFGQVTAYDAAGQEFMLNASDFPVLPGRSEAIALVPETITANDGSAELPFPIRLDGHIEIGGERLEVRGIIE